MTDQNLPEDESAPPSTRGPVSDGWQMVSRLSHTFRTPLNHVLGFSEILNSQSFGELNDRQLNYVKKIQAAGHRQLKLLDQLVDVARVITGELTTGERNWELQAALDHVVKTAEPEASTREIDIVIQGDGNTSLRGDFDRFCHVLDCLVSYAIKRSSLQGSVTIKVDRLEGQVTDDVSPTTAMTFSIVDTGIPPTPMERSLLETGDPDGQGQLADVEGLGLLHARALTGKLCGCLGMSHDAGTTTVTFTVPFKQLTAIG